MLGLRLQSGDICRARAKRESVEILPHTATPGDYFSHYYENHTPLPNSIGWAATTDLAAPRNLPSTYNGPPNVRGHGRQGVESSRNANDVDQARKHRVEIEYEACTHAYLFGVYNGWSLPVEMDPEGQRPVSHPGYSYNTATLGNGVIIFRTVLKSMGRNDIHMAPFRMSARQASSPKYSVQRKTHIAVTDGAKAARAGIQLLLYRK